MIAISRLSGIGLLAILLAWISWESQWSPQPLEAPPADEPQDAPVAMEELSFPPLSDYPATLAQPLFFPGRVMPGAGATAGPDDPNDGPPGTTTASRLVLSAVIIEDGQASALLQIPGQPSSMRLRAGESIGGWRVVEISEDKVTVETAGKREQIPLRTFPTAPSTPTGRQQTTPALQLAPHRVRANRARSDDSEDGAEPATPNE